MFKTLTFFVILSGIIGWINGAVNLTRPSATVGSIRGQNELSPYSIDIGSCHCVPFDKRCEVSVGKSIIMAIECPENHHYCCNRRKVPLVNDKDKLPKKVDQLNGSKSPNVTKKSASPLSPRVHIWIPSTKKSGPETEVPGPNALASSTKPRPQIKCRCAARDQCEPKYTDYTFGFHCSYDTVHCCEPQELIQMRLGTPQNNASRLEPGLGTRKETQCLCLAPEECPETRVLESTTNAEDRKDTLCPFQLVRCCVAPILKRNDPDGIEKDDMGLPSGAGPQEPGTAGIEMQGQPTLRDPAQLTDPEIQAQPETKNFPAEDPFLQFQAPSLPSQMEPSIEEPVPVQYYAPPQYPGRDTVWRLNPETYQYVPYHVRGDLRGRGWGPGMSESSDSVSGPRKRADKGQGFLASISDYFFG